MVEPGIRSGVPYPSLCEYRNIQPRARAGCRKSVPAREDRYWVYLVCLVCLVEKDQLDKKISDEPQAKRAAFFNRLRTKKKGMG